MKLPTLLEGFLTLIAQFWANLKINENSIIRFS